MYLIKWRNRKNGSFRIVTGLSRYGSIDHADKQIALWSRVFPDNAYYIESIKEVSII